MEYKIVDCFNVINDIMVLVLDKEWEPCKCRFALIDGQKYEFNLNSVQKWVTIHSHDDFRGKTVKFIE